MAGHANNSGNQNSIKVRSSLSRSPANTKVCLQKSTDTVNRGKHPVQINCLRTEQKTNITGEPTQRRASSSICTSKLSNKVLEDASIFEIQRLIHVVSWTELFLDKHHTSDSLQEIAQSFVRSTLNHDAEKRGTQNIRDIQNKKPEYFDMERLPSHTSDGLSSFVISKNILGQTEKGASALSNSGTLNSSLDEICPTQTIKYEQECQKEREAILEGEREVEVHKHSARRKARFQNSYIVYKGDYSISATVDLHENLDSYFWPPLSDSLDEKGTDVKAKRDTLIKTNINLPSSTRFLKSDHMKHPSISVLGDGLPSTRNASSLEKGTLAAENLAEFKEKDTFKDFIQTLKSENSSGTNDNAESTAEQVRTRNNPFDPEAQKDELSFLDFQFQKKGTFQKKETKTVHMSGTDKSFEENKYIGKEQTDNPSRGENCTGARELELQPLKNNPSILTSSVCTNVLLKPLGNTTCEVSSGSFDHYKNNYSCVEGDSVTQNTVPKYMQDDINKHVSEDFIKSTVDPKSNSEEFLIQSVKADRSKTLFAYDKFFSESLNEDSVLAQYYFYLDYLSQSKMLQPEESDRSFSCEELNDFSQDGKLAAYCHFKNSNRIKDADIEDADSDFVPCGKNCCKDKIAEFIRPLEEKESKYLFTDSCPRSLSHLALTDQRKLGNIHSSKGKVRLF